MSDVLVTNGLVKMGHLPTHFATTDSKSSMNDL